MKQIYVDLDGVLANMTAYYKQITGRAHDINNPDKKTDKIFWEDVNAHNERGGRFFLELPVMPDAHVLWDGVRKFDPSPVILTGGGDDVYPQTRRDKREWIDKYFGQQVGMICCRSATKRDYCSPGDILIDDWFKYQHLWEAAGGTFILHTCADDSLRQLADIWNE
jgi:hypothetical protein